MKKFVIGISLMLLLGLSIEVKSQSDFTAPDARLTISVALPEVSEALPEGSRNYLINKLKQAAIQNGMAAEEGYSRFAITATLMPLDRNIVAGPPTQIAQNMEVTFYIVDAYDKKIFSSTTLNATGVGTNETKSLNEVIKGINPKSQAIQEFATEGKQKIIAYYDAQCAQIIKKAQHLATQKSFDAAFYELAAVPDVCTCYDQILAVGDAIYQQYIDYWCHIHLEKAKMAWAAEQNRIGATKAGEYLAQIDPDANCYADAQKLYDEIKGKVLDDWKFTMKIYQDGVDISKARINAWRDVGVAYGRNQQPTTNYINWLSR